MHDEELRWPSSVATSSVQSAQVRFPSDDSVGGEPGVSHLTSRQVENEWRKEKAAHWAYSGHDWSDSSSEDGEEVDLHVPFPSRCILPLTRHLPLMPPLFPFLFFSGINSAYYQQHRRSEEWTYRYSTEEEVLTNVYRSQSR